MKHEFVWLFLKMTMTWFSHQLMLEDLKMVPKYETEVKQKPPHISKIYSCTLVKEIVNSIEHHVFKILRSCVFFCGIPTAQVKGFVMNLFLTLFCCLNFFPLQDWTSGFPVIYYEFLWLISDNFPWILLKSPKNFVQNDFPYISAQPPNKKHKHTSRNFPTKNPTPTPHFPTKKLPPSQKSVPPKIHQSQSVHLGEFVSNQNTTKLNGFEPPGGFRWFGPGISLSWGFLLPTKPSRGPRDPYMLDVYGKIWEVNIPKMSRGSIMGSWKSRVCQLFAKKVVGNFSNM